MNIRKSLTDTTTLFYSKVNRLHALDAVKAVYLKKSFLTKPKICMLHIFKNEEREQENFGDISDSHICNPSYQQHEASSYSLPLCLNEQKNYCSSILANLCYLAKSLKAVL